MLLVAGCAGGGSNAGAQPGNQLSTAPTTTAPTTTAPTTTAPTTTAPTTTAPVTGGTVPAVPGVRVPAGATPVTGKQLNASALPSGFPRTVWVDKNGSELGFYGEEGGCFTSNATVAQQTDTQIVVRLVQQQPGTGNHACPMFVRYKPMTVQLTRPLASRTVVLQLSIVRG
jgi:cytoskeletal protein RodZ